MSCVLKYARRRTKRACLATRCSKDKCSVSLEGMSGNRLIIDTEHKQSPGFSEADEKCDYLFICEPSDNEVWIAPMEFKVGNGKASKIADQLQSGADVAKRLISSKAFDNHDMRLRPVFACIKMDKHQRESLRRKIVTLGKYKEKVRTLRCGDRLSRAFDF